MSIATISYPWYQTVFSNEEYQDSKNVNAVHYSHGSIATLGELNMDEFKWYYDHFMEMLLTYDIGVVGGLDAGNMLGFLEDTYPEFMRDVE